MFVLVMQDHFLIEIFQKYEDYPYFDPSPKPSPNDKKINKQNTF